MRRNLFGVSAVLTVCVNATAACMSPPEPLDEDSGEAIIHIDEVQEVLDVAFSPDGRWLASGLDSGTVMLWDLARGRKSFALEPNPGDRKRVRVLKFSPNGRLLAAAASAGRLTVWELETRAEVLSIRIEKTGSVSFTQDGQWIAAGTDDGQILIYSVETGKKWQTHEGDGYRVLALYLNRDGTAVNGLSTRMFRDFWDERDMPRGLQDSLATTLRLEFSPTRRLVAVSVANRLSVQSMKQETVNPADALFHAASSPFPAHQEVINDLAFSSDDEWLATASEDATVKLWRLDPAEEDFQLEGHSGPVTSVSFSPDGRWLASGSEDGSTRVWDLSSDSEVLSLSVMNGRHDWLALSAEGWYDGTEEAVRAWVTCRGRDAAANDSGRGCGRTYTPHLLALALSGNPGEH